MKKIVRHKNKKSNKRQIIYLFGLLLLLGITVIVLPTTQTKNFSYGAAIPYSPVPAKPNLQLDWFLVPTGAPATTQNGTTQPTNSPPPQQPVTSKQPKPTLPGGGFIPIVAHPTSDFAALRTPPIKGVGPTTPKSNGQLCSAGDDSGKAVSGACYCPDLTVTCKNGKGYGANGAIYPGPNPCGTSVAPGSGRYCVEKPVIYLYPIASTQVNVQVITSGSVVVSDPTYPQGGWKNILANPDGTLHYNDKKYSELFYESSVNTFQKPHLGTTLPKAHLAEKLSLLLDQLGLVDKEKEEFLSFWLPQLQAMPTPYVFFSILTPSAKANIDTVAITPKPDTQIAFIAYFKAATQPASDTLQLPLAPKRKGFVSVEWGGVIDTK